MKSRFDEKPPHLLEMEEDICVEQHYNFVDFKKFGSDWSPDWFAVVRDPVEKVSQTVLNKSTLKNRKYKTTYLR